jgi:transcriptional regulator with XRE-family HTH domain
MSDEFAVGRQVLDVRVSKNLRQSDVAAKAGVGRAMVSRLERGLPDGMTV